MSEYEEQVRKEARQAAEDLGRRSEVPTILICGKTGSGKSSLCNAIAGANVQEVGVVPTTQTPEVVQIPDGDLVLQVYDVAGFGEADMHEERVDTMLSLLDRVHVILLVVGHPDRALDHETAFLARLRRHFAKKGRRMPLIVAANRIDVAKPARTWDPASLNLTEPADEKAQNIVKWLKYVSAELSKNYEPASVRACAASEFWNDRDRQYGIEELRMDIYDVLPEAAQTYFARVVADAAIREKRANRIIFGAAASAAAISAQPLPGVPDAVLLAPIQMTMITAIATVYGADPNKIDGFKLVGPALTSVGGRLAFQQAVKFIPGFGSIAAAGVASVITLALGQAYHYLIKNGIFAPSPEEFQDAFTRFHQVMTS